MACVKIYLCSNPEDSVVERKVLREDVFPKLREDCRRTYGLDFRIIDPYEGMDPGSWPTQKERLQLLDECRQNSLGPFFVGLVGRQYGGACLPEQVELSEFLTILQVGQQMGCSSAALEKCYRRNENTIPPSFCLLSQHAYQKQHDTHPRSKLEKNSWHDVVAMGRKILNEVVNQCLLEGNINPEKAQKYFRSSLENDLRYALQDSPANERRCLCYVHNTSGEADQEKNGNEQHFEFQSSRMKQLRDDFLPGLVKSHRVLVYTTAGDCVCQQRYAEELGQQLSSHLMGLVHSSVAMERHQAYNPLSQQRHLCHVFSRLYRIERVEVSQVKAYLEQDTKYPFILIGGPCTGKTVFLAHCASQIKTWMKDQNPVVIVHFTDMDGSLKETLSSLCHQIALYYNQPYNVCPKDLAQLKKTFCDFLARSSLSPNPLILIIDGLDQIPNTNGPLDLSWLPRTLLSNIKLLISSTPTKSGFLSAMKTHYPESPLLFELGLLESKSCNQMLSTLLSTANKKITSGQQMYVNQAIKQCSLPLYIELLYRQICNWSSELEVTAETLVPGIHTNIGRFLDHLEEKHGKVLVGRSLEYLTLSRCGLTEAELTDILSCDDEVLATFLPVKNSAPYKCRVPEFVVERLLLDLKGFLGTRITLGIQTLFWISRHFNLVIFRRYLCSNEQKKRHSVLANYFSGRWARGTSKLLSISGNYRMKMPKPQVIQNGVPVKISTDGQIPGQPWMFQASTSDFPANASCECTHPNMRKLHELPFHLMQSGNIEELGRVLMSPEFLYATFHAGQGEDLMFWLETASPKVFHRELGLLTAVLKPSVCWLTEYPADLALIMQANVFPFIHVFPALEDTVNHDGAVGSTEVNTVLSPTPSVPATHWVLPTTEMSPITKAAISHSGFAIVIQNNGCAWVLNGNYSQAIKLPQSSEVKFTDVRCSTEVFMLTTQCGKLLSWDINALSQLHEVQMQHQDPNSISTMEGVLVSNGMIFLFSKGTSSVSVLAEDMAIAPLQCPYNVTCMSCSVDGHMIFCGQKKGIVSVFDSQSGHLLGSFICSKGMSLFDLILHENGETMTCVDCTGSLFVWDLKIITKPALVKESFSHDKWEVLNTDYSESDHLLICKKQQIQIIDGHFLDTEDQFNSPKGKTFVQAVLDHHAHFIIAIMEDCLFIFVWNRLTGQCVLTLDIRGTQAFKLVKIKDNFLTAVTSTGITHWDMDLISVAASTPKSNKKVLKVVVERGGDHFYTSDGSEQVWRWAVLGGRVAGLLLHCGPVGALALSADCTHIVTIASGDIYIWDTSTNENIHRICGSQASQILTTPKGKFAVSLSEISLSRVWKLCSGHVVCSIHHHLRDAVISPESTFLLGIQSGDLLAVSLWSGYVGSRFSRSVCSEVVAFHPLADHPEYVVVITISGALYTWKLTDETVCHQFQFPQSFQYPSLLFKLSSDGMYGIISVVGSKINIVDTYHGKLYSLNAEGQVCQQFVDMSDKYVVYICKPSVRCQSCSFDPNIKQILAVQRVKDGKRVGMFYFCKTPSALALSETLCVYVGFEDGSIGMYAISDPEVGYINSRDKCQSARLMSPIDEPVVWTPMANPDLIWVDVVSQFP
ncbi:NACHT and WD repeat domain-containing protein 2 isoform X1 [Brachyhypopomus gauderio]|uniref:NACHT and WD repeat domain-containing protein 2 isoform X1 n=1 Tax=Brachyhypopomus gauderio TaxID=698409 RepID=UPI0040411B2E